MVAPKVTPGFWKELLGYLGLCLFEALLAAALVYVSLLVLWPMANGGTSGATACAVIAFLFLGPILWAGCVAICLLAKIVVVLMPPSRRHWSLAIYWGLTAGAIAWHAISDARRSSPYASPSIANTLLAYGLYAIPALILTFSHFVLLPRIKPGASARSVFALLRRRPTEPPAGLPPQDPPA